MHVIECFIVCCMSHRVAIRTTLEDCINAKSFPLATNGSDSVNSFLLLMLFLNFRLLISVLFLSYHMYCFSCT